MTDTDGMTVFDTPEMINAYQLMMLRRGLAFEAKTGMKMTGKVSLLNIAREMGLTNKGTKHGAWQDVDLYMRKLGLEGMDAITLKNGRVIKPLKLK